MPEGIGYPQFEDDMGLTGPVQGGDPQNLVSAWRDWVSKPENKAGLMQAGLQMMQPIAPGQSPSGQLAQSVGAGFKAHDDNLLKRAEAEQIPFEQGLAERKVGALETSAQSRQGISMNSLFSAQNRDRQNRAKFYQDQAKSIAKQALDASFGDPAANPYPEFVGKGEQEILETIMSDPTWSSRLEQQWQSLNSGTPAVGPTSSPLGGQRPRVEEFVNQYPGQWTKIKSALQSGDPGIQEKARQHVERLKSMVSDPQVVDQLLAQ